MSRERRRLLASTSLVVALIAFGIADVGANGSVENSLIQSAIDATERTIAAQSIADQLLVVGAGGLLFGVGVGVVIASGVTYWYKNRQIAGRLR